MKDDIRSHRCGSHFTDKICSIKMIVEQRLTGILVPRPFVLKFKGVLQNCICVTEPVNLH